MKLLEKLSGACNKALSWFLKPKVYLPVSIVLSILIAFFYGRHFHKGISAGIINFLLAEAAFIFVYCTARLYAMF